MASRMTVVGVAPRGFDGTTLGSKPEVFVPITLRELMQHGGAPKPFENRRSYWIYLFARLRSGTSIDRARAELNGQYHAIVNRIEAPLQEGMSEQTMKRFRAKTLTVEEGPRGQSTVRDEVRATDAAAAGRDGLRPADCLRQHRQPAAGAIGGARVRRWPSACRSAPVAGT